MMNIRYLFVLSLLCMLSPRVIAADDPFLGNWKLRLDRSRFAGFQEKIEDLGGYKYRFTTGDKVETIVLDGEDHPNGKDTTWALRQIGPNRWKSIDKVNGQITATSIWTVSNDGQTFTSVTEGINPDGSPYKREFAAKRLAGKSGLTGIWTGAGPKEYIPTDWSIQPYQSDGLSFISKDGGERLDLKFDGKDYPDSGRHIAPGSTVSAQRVDQRTIEMAGKVNGKPAYLQRVQVSKDGRTLAVGIAAVNGAITAVYYYDRQ
jgi:hypothetical protein